MLYGRCASGVFIFECKLKKKTEQRKKSCANVVRPERINKPPKIKNLCWKLGIKNKIIGKQ